MYHTCSLSCIRDDLLKSVTEHTVFWQARREKISERMKLLQDLVPGCNKVVHTHFIEKYGSSCSLVSSIVVLLIEYMQEHSM